VLFNLAAKWFACRRIWRQIVVIRDTAKEILCPDLGTLYKALSAEASTAHGQSPVFAVHDELGQVKGPVSELYDAVENANGRPRSPLSIIISTQAPTDGTYSRLIDDALEGSDPTGSQPLHG
jgi:phage terminase large subunit-like protein